MRIDPADRSGAWRTELRNGLADALRSANESGHEMRVALRATADRVTERVRDHELWSLPRGEEGFIEIAQEPARELWWSTHLAPQSAASVYLTGQPVLVPFLRLAARCGPRGVALVSAERVRLLQWEPGHIEELHSWEPLIENRHRFLGECGRLAAQIGLDREWADVVAFSSPQYVDCFRRGFDSTSPDLVLGGEVDLIAESAGKLLGLVEAAVDRRDAEDDWRLVESALDETRGGAHGVAGAEETLAALEEGRVEHLIVSDDSEPLVRRALATGARITPVCGDAADLLAPSDGVAALLRY